MPRTQGGAPRDRGERDAELDRERELEAVKGALESAMGSQKRETLGNFMEGVTFERDL